MTSTLLEDHQDAPTEVSSKSLLVGRKKKIYKRPWFIAIVSVVTICILATITIVVLHKTISTGRHAQTQQSTAEISTTKSPPPSPTATVQGLQLDSAKEYGNRYANDILPVGDNKYVTSGAKQGYVYACSPYAQNLTSGQGGGAATRGPWFIDNNTEYDLSKKVHVQGSVTWKGSFSDTASGANRIITSNDLPTHATGVFPISSSDPAYVYDRNPNNISTQNLTYTLPLDPTYSTTPYCMGGEVGIMLTGVALFNGFDAEGRDAGAWEVQDGCSGHPEKDGKYHYHTLSSCIKDTNIHTVIGFALDGYPITGPKLANGSVLTTTDLDECHGIVSAIQLDGKAQTIYHYVMTQDFPYSVSCFRAQPITTGPTGGTGNSNGASTGSLRQGPPPRT